MEVTSLMLGLGRSNKEAEGEDEGEGEDGGALDGASQANFRPGHIGERRETWWVIRPPEIRRPSGAEAKGGGQDVCPEGGLW